MNSNLEKRQLSVILFADIVGYSALMGQDEASAAIALKKFRTQLETQIDAYRGQIINFYGDGCLAIFENPLKAISCAVELQKTFQQSPAVPVRTGLHSGVVVIEEGNAYGDAINQASRIESLGQPGSVLISQQLKHHLSNQNHLKTQSLGKFRFKNIAQPIEVFALQVEGLTVPKASDLRGKTEKRIGKNTTMAGSLLIVIMLIAVLGIWWYQSTYNYKVSAASETTDMLPSEILKERIAVIPMRNSTNDVQLNVLGEMAADWITRGLMEIESAEVVSPFTVQQNLASVGILSGDPKGRTSFSELTGARYIIYGHYAMQNDTINFLLELGDAVTGSTLLSFPEVNAHVKDQEVLLDKVREKTTGYWAAKKMVDQKQIKVPHYQAYKIFIEAGRSRHHGISSETLGSILSLDSTFYLPRIEFLLWNRTGLGGNNDYHFAFLDRHLGRLSKYEKGLYTYVKNIYQGNALSAFESLEKLYKKYPKSLDRELGFIALNGLNNPKLALEIWSNIYSASDPFPDYSNFGPMWSMYAAIRLSDTALVKRYYSELRMNRSAWQFPYWLAKLQGAATLNKEKEFDDHLSNYFSDNEDATLFATWILAAFSNSTIFSDLQGQKIETAIINYVNQSNRKQELRDNFPYMLALMQGADPIIDWEKLNALPVIFRISNMAAAGIELARQGDRNNVESIIAELESLTEPGLNLSPESSSGASHYALALIYTQMGQYAQAIDHLTEARKLGMWNYEMLYDYDRRLAPLFDMPAFQRLNQPKWPRVID